MSKRRTLVLMLMSTLLAGCQGQSSTGSWEEPERLNGEPGALGRFTSPYYNAIHPLPGGGALAAFMRGDDRFATFVVRRAPDGGAPFAPEQSITPENLTQSQGMGPEIANGPGPNDVYVVWQARRLASGEKYILFRRSEDAGATWSEPKILSSETNGPFLPDLAADNSGGVYVVWPDERVSGLNVFFNRSLDRGDTFLPTDMGIEPERNPGNQALSVSIAADAGGRLAVVWEDQMRGGRQVYAATSADRGATWKAPVRVDDQTGHQRLSPTAPRVVFAGGRAVVVWTGAATGSGAMAQVWGDVSSDGGTTWGEDVLLQETRGGTASRIDLLSDGTTAHLVLHAGRFATDSQIYYTATDPNGQWRGHGETLTRISQRDGQFANPRLAIDGDATLYVAYEDALKRVLLARSLDSGATWDAEPDVVHALPDSDTTSRIRYPQLAASGGTLYVMWEHWSQPPPSTAKPNEPQPKRPVDLYVRRGRFRR